MFEWNVSDMKLMNEFKFFIGKKKVYSAENELSREEKIEFVDKMNDGILSYTINLVEKFKKDRNNLPKDKWGSIKTVSLKAWLKRNDIRNVADNWYYYGKIHIIGSERHISKFDKKGQWDYYDDIVDETFYRTLCDCERKERQYFKEHDEYEILKTKFRNKKYNTTFGVNIGFCSNGDVYIYDENNHDKERNITIEELKYLLEQYDKLDKLVKEITEKTNIKY